MANFSEKKYIINQARKLPLYGCYINKNWKQFGMATVLVLRQHKNNKFTLGMYLTDLKCLGVKDTDWRFNVTFNEFKERVRDFDTEFEAIDYTLAHNIIYAGHDFAMDFDIYPHKDFSITKYILEEDTENIELIDIEVGENGIPHLIVEDRNKFKLQLNLLKKNAGEGNYLLTIGEELNDFEYMSEEEENEDYDDEYEEDFLDDEKTLEDYAPGTLTPLNAFNLSNEEMNNFEAIKKRGLDEQLYFAMEYNRRLYLGKKFNSKTDSIWIDEEVDWFDNIEMDENNFWLSSEDLPLFYNTCNSFFNNLQGIENQEEKLKEFILSQSSQEVAFMLMYMRDVNDSDNTEIKINLGFEKCLSILKLIDNKNFQFLMETFMHLVQFNKLNNPNLILILEGKFKDASFLLNKENNCDPDLLSLYAAIKFMWYIKSFNLKMAFEYYYFSALSAYTATTFILFPQLQRSLDSLGETTE